MLLAVLALWPYVKTVDRCHVLLEHPPQAELDKLTAAAKARFGTTTKIDLNFLGSQVDSVEFTPPLPMGTPAKTALSEAALSVRGVAYVRANADLFGISGEVGQLDKLALHRDKRSQLWLGRTVLHRNLHGVDRDVRVHVTMTELGEIHGIFVDGDVPPDYPLCDAPTLAIDDPKIMGAVIGKELYYLEVDGSKTSFGKVTKDEIKLVRPIVDSVTRMPPEEDNSNPHEYARGYAVYVQHMSKGKISPSDPGPTVVTWEFLVDGETGKQLGSWNLADLPKP
jgi:hypothetical protein